MTPTRVMLSILFLLGPAVYAVVPPPITGDYVEVRSNHVYTCGCLYSGEQVTSGAEAILTWSIREGEFQGVPLSGLRVVAVVQGQGNLALPGVTRKSVLLIDSSASDSQRQALRRLFQEQYGNVLGEVIGVHPTPISFQKDGERVSVSAGDISRVIVRPARLPDDAHQGSIRWYEPFIRTTESTLSTTEYRKYSGGDFDHRWWNSEPGITGYIASFEVTR